MRAVVATFVALTCLGGAAVAQTAQSSASASAASAPAEDPVRLAKARELFAAMHLDASLKGVFDNMFQSAANQMADGPNKDKAQAFLHSFSGAFEAHFPELIDGMAQVYARNLSTQELTDSLAFYRSASGQAILAKMPVMMKEALPLSFQMMPKIAADAEADYCAKQTCADAERTVFNRMKAVGAPRTR